MKELCKKSKANTGSVQQVYFNRVLNIYVGYRWLAKRDEMSFHTRPASHEL